MNNRDTTPHKTHHSDLANLYRWEAYGERHGNLVDSYRNWALVDGTGRVRTKITRDDSGLWTVNKTGRVTIRRRHEQSNTTQTLLRGAQYTELAAAKLAVEAAEIARVDQLRATAQTEAVQ